MRVEFSRILNLLARSGFTECARSANCFSLTDSAKRRVVTIAGFPEHGVGSTFLTRLLVHLGYPQAELGPCATGAGGGILEGEVAGWTLSEQVRHLEKQLVRDALERFGNVAQAAAALGISRPTLYEKMNAHGLDNPHSTGKSRPRNQNPRADLNITGASSFLTKATKEAIVRALIESAGNRAKAASRLGISEQALLDELRNVNTAELLRMKSAPNPVGAKQGD